MLSRGVSQFVNKNIRVTTVADLPKEPFCITTLGYSGRPVKLNDSDLVVLKGCVEIYDLDLTGSNVTDAGLTHLRDCKKLATGRLIRTQVSGDGLAVFKGCHLLHRLFLNNTPVDDGLARLSECRGLVVVNAGKTKVTAAVVAELQKALPECKIFWDGAPAPRRSSRAF